MDDQFAADVRYVIETQCRDSAKFMPALKLTNAQDLLFHDRLAPQPDGSFRITGSKGAAYVWSPEAGCTCKQATEKHVFCYHAAAVEIYQRVQQLRGQHQPSLGLPPQTVDERLAHVPPQEPEGQGAGWPEEDEPGDDDLPHTRQARNQAATPMLDELDRLPPLSEAPLPGLEAEVPVDVPSVLSPPWLLSDTTPLGGTGQALRSRSVAQVIGALVRAQASIRNPRFDAQNPHFKTRYASLAAVRDALTPALAQEGLVVTQILSSDGGGVVCETILWHTSGEYLGNSLRLPVGKNDAQSYGGAATYARRYGLMALCNVVGDEDADGEDLIPQDNGRGESRLPEAQVQAQKRRIAELLKAQGKRLNSASEAQQAVLALTGLALEPAHYGEIIKRLDYYGSHV